MEIIGNVEMEARRLEIHFCECYLCPVALIHSEVAAPIYRLGKKAFQPRKIN